MLVRVGFTTTIYPMKSHSLVQFAGILAGMSLGAREAVASPLSALPLAQIPASLKLSFQYGLGVMFLVGFLWGVIKIWNGADKMSKGDADGKMGIISGIIIAGAAAIMGALFTIFGVGDGILQPLF